MLSEKKISDPVFASRVENRRRVFKIHPSPILRRQAEITGPADDAVPVLRHRRRQIANPAIVQLNASLPPR